MQKVLSKITGHGKEQQQFDQSDVSDLRGRTALVTGGTQGIGYEVAHALALAKARVLLLSRKEENGSKAVASIKEEDPAADVEFVECDLGNLMMVRDVADRIRESEPRLDLLIADAGIGVNAFELTASGIDRHFGMNHLGHFLLINRLLPLLRRTAALPGAPAPRIVCVASERHTSTPSSVRFANVSEVTEDIGLGPNGYYARSKLAVILFVKYGLVERVLKPNGDRIIAVATHPGPVHTNQPEQLKEGYGRVLGTVIKAAVVPFMRDPEHGSLSTLWAATSDEVERNKELQGAYFTEPGDVSSGSKMAQDPELGKNLWVLSEKLITEKLGPDGLLSWDRAEN
ncbi:NAD-P-binding protein [Pilatotrama ljubarskyi]|nr:NAD-P-binding protein [Pilatotrama ljubarskyi]